VDETTVVAAADIGAFLARCRPPACRSITVCVPAHCETGSASHEAVLTAALRELMNFWPAGTALVINYPSGVYAQALAYPPALLTEIGQVTYSQLVQAVELGWIDPLAVPHRHPDFQSQREWIDNPVREWDYPNDALPDIASFLARSVREVLGRDPAAGYTVTLFNDRPEGDDEDPPDPDPPSGDVVENPTVSISPRAVLAHR
jgi:hypothetical protein